MAWSFSFREPIEKASSPPACPTCGGELMFISGGRLGGERFYAERIVYRCPAHGLVWHTREGMRNQRPHNADDGTSGVRAPLTPARPSGSVAASAIEPE